MNKRSKIIDAKLGENGSYVCNGNRIDEIREYNNNKILERAMRIVNRRLKNEVEDSAEYVSSLENIADKYYYVQNDLNEIYNNEFRKYEILMTEQNNLLNKIDKSETSLWRYNDKLYYRTNSGQLIIDNPSEIAKEISSRYSFEVSFVNDMNDVLISKKQIRVNTIFIAINCLIIVDKEKFYSSRSFEIVETSNGNWNRNLLAHTRYIKKRNFTDNDSVSYAKNVMSNITKESVDYITPWINNIDTTNDTILLLVGNKKVSEDLIIDKVIKRLFDTDIVVTLTDEKLQKNNFEEVINGKLFLLINHIPQDEVSKEKLKKLLFSIIVHRSVQSDDNTIPTQIRVIVTIDEVDIFFKDCMEITSTIFVDTEVNILEKLRLNNLLSAYLEIEKSLDNYSFEIENIQNNNLVSYQNNNIQYLKLLEELEMPIESISNKGLPILDPSDDSFNDLIQKHNCIHSLVLGGSGAGKTEEIKTMIYCNILRNDGSVIIIDPHGDFAIDILSLPMDKNRIVFIDPTLKDNMTPTLNIFESEGSISERDVKLKANIIISVVKAINDEEKFSSSMEEMLYHCICVLIRKGDSSFKELLLFMNGNKSQKLVELGVQSPNELDSEYFEDYFDHSSSKQTKDALRRRLKKLLSDHYFSNLVNGKSTFNLEELMNTKGKVIIFNVNKYNMPEHYGYFTRFIIELIQKIAFNRATIPKEERIPTYCYIDEGQNFITPKIEEVLTEVRKYNLQMNFSFQSIHQIKNKATRNIMITNTNTKFFGKDDNVSSEIWKKILNKEAIEKIPNLSAGQFYLKANNQDLLLTQNTDKLLDGKINISEQELREVKQEQLIYYRTLENQTIQPTKDELLSMIKKFKADFISKNLTESSCLNKLKSSDPKRFKEITNDFEFVTTKDKQYRPRVRQKEISSVFTLAFELDYTFDNSKFIQTLKGESDMFNQTDSGTRSGEFTDNRKTQTEQYYYFHY